MFFIINPTAARGGALREWNRARRELQRRQAAFAEHITAYAGEATTVTRDALRAGRDCVIAVGGDGTLNEVVNGYFDEAGAAINPSAAIGLLPGGSGSDFRRSIGGPTGSQALATILSGRRRSIDVARVDLSGQNGERISRDLINVASFGLGGDAVALVSSWRKTWPRLFGGRIRYTAAALLALRKYRPVTVSILLDQSQTTVIQSGFFVVANGRFAGGGMMLAPHAELDDGQLDVILIDGATRWEIVRELPRIQHGEYLLHPKVSHARARTVEISSDAPLAVDLDGEFAGYTPARLTLIHSAIRFIVGR